MLMPERIEKDKTVNVHISINLVGNLTELPPNT